MESPTLASNIEKPPSDIESQNSSPEDVPYLPYNSSDRYVRAVGKHIPALGGRGMVADVECGPNLLWVSVSLIVFPTGLWLACEANTYWNEVSPAGVIAILCTFLLSNGFIFVARYTEPGLLPTKIKYDPEHEGLSANEMKMVKKVFNVVLQGQRFDLGDFRAKFCSQTANCIEKFDHFCPWVGNAVGIRNYRYFVGFVTFTTVHSILVGALAIVLLTRVEGTLIEKVQARPVSLLLAVYCTIITLMVGGLASYHWQIIFTNTTTNEELKDVWARRRNPYDKGCCNNIYSFLCTPLRGSYMREGAEDWLAGSSLAENWDSEADSANSKITGA